MNFSISHLKFRILFIVITMLFLWQAIRVLPWLQTVQVEANGNIAHSSPIVQEESVLVTIFYEALCPDSKSFITKQVLPVFEKTPKLISISLIPYGKAKTIEDRSGNFTFSCQHGPIECQANKIHACAIASISDMETLIKFVSCMISNNMKPEYICEECGKQFSVDWKEILKCSKSKKGTDLLKNYGKITNDLIPTITFIPTVLLNNKYKKQSAILKNLFTEVCAMYEKVPVECSDERHISVFR